MIDPDDWKAANLRAGDRVKYRRSMAVGAPWFTGEVVRVAGIPLVRDDSTGQERWLAWFKVEPLD